MNDIAFTEPDLLIILVALAFLGMVSGLLSLAHYKTESTWSTKAKYRALETHRQPSELKTGPCRRMRSGIICNSELSVVP